MCGTFNHPNPRFVSTVLIGSHREPNHYRFKGEPTCLASIIVAMPTVNTLVGTFLTSPPKYLVLLFMICADEDLTLVLDPRLDPV